MHIQRVSMLLTHAMRTQNDRLEAQIKRSGGAGTKAEKALAQSENKVADLTKELRKVDACVVWLQLL